MKRRTQGNLCEIRSMLQQGGIGLSAKTVGMAVKRKMQGSPGSEGAKKKKKERKWEEKDGETRTNAGGGKGTGIKVTLPSATTPAKIEEQ